MDISKLSISELEALAANIPAEIKKRKAAEKEQVLQEVMALASSRGFGLDELLGKKTIPAAAAKTTTRKPAKIKYRHPQQAELTWTGRGRQPLWISEWMSGGNKLEALLVE